MKMTNLKSAIERVLVKYPSARDDDNACYIWICNEEWKIDLLNTSALDFLQRIGVGRCPRFDSVSRIRRELQNEREDLRGKEWILRHEEADFLRKNRFATKELTGI